jgi:D-3-phosphoglycerate dehydrogenase
MKPLKQCKVLVTPTSYASQDESLKSDLEREVAQVVYNTTGKPLSSEQLQDLLGDIDGMIAGLDELDVSAINAAPELKVIARYGVGYNNVDLQAAKSRGVIVTNTPGANAKAVAELCVSLILNLLRPIIQCSLQTSQGGWPRYKGYSLENKTVGLVGFGAIGKEAARRLAGFECEILAVDLIEDVEFAAQYGVSFTTLDDLLSRADIVSLHLPGTQDTVRMVDDSFFGKMKTGAYLVNTARGDLVDEQALINALESEKIAGAALDVFQDEPPSKDHPFLKLDNLILTPHMGAHADSATNAMGRMALSECLKVLRGEEPSFRIA